MWTTEETTALGTASIPGGGGGGGGQTKKEGKGGGWWGGGGEGADTVKAMGRIARIALNVGQWSIINCR